MTFGLVKHRALFISDIHLGAPSCQAERLYHFLKGNTADRIYLVGDILDGSIGRWPLYHDLVLSALLRHARHGADIVYVPGNHDAFMRHHYGTYGSVRIARRARHACADGRVMLIAHGDEHDCIGPGGWLKILAGVEGFTGLSLWNQVRRLFRHWIDRHVKVFEDQARAAGMRRHDGVICGHIHEPKITRNYMNCGDWIHHCTAIVEHRDGRFELLHG